METGEEVPLIFCYSEGDVCKSLARSTCAGNSKVSYVGTLCRAVLANGAIIAVYSWMIF